MFLEPVSYARHHKRRGTTVSSLASSIVNNLAIRPSRFVRRYVVHVRHLIQYFLIISKDVDEFIIFPNFFLKTSELIDLNKANIKLNG